MTEFFEGMLNNSDMTISEAFNTLSHVLVIDAKKKKN